MLQASPRRFIAPIGVATMMTVLIYSGSLVLGTATMAIIGGSAVLAYFVWLATGWQRPIDPKLITVPYIVLIAMELLHMAEEQLTDFPGSLARIFPIPHSFDLLSHAVLLMGLVNILALLAAVGIRSTNTVVRQVAAFVVWFYVIGPGMVNAVAHVTFPFLAHSWYFSGLVTVAFPTVAGLVTLFRLVESDRNAKAGGRGMAPAAAR